MTDLSLVFSPLVPWLALALLSLLATSLLAFSLYKGQGRAPWRGLALALFLLALANPTLLEEEREKEKSVVAIILDMSESQTLGNRTQQVEAARRALDTALARFPDLEPRFVTVGTEAEGTKLFAGLAQALADTPPERVGAAILVTDGLVHDIPAKAEALGFKAPLHALITGRAGERDRRLDLVETPHFGVVGKDVVMRVRVVDSPARSGEAQSAEVVAKRDGAVIARHRAQLGEIVEIPVAIEHGGPNVIELETPPIEGELTDVDNRGVVVVEGVRDRLKVLLVSGEPHQGERSWRNLLRADANVELVHFTILRPPDKVTGAPPSELSLIAFPTADLFGRRIKDFDLIIFDRYSSQTLLPSSLFREHRELRRRRRRLPRDGRRRLRDAAGSLLLAPHLHPAGAPRWGSL